MSKPMISVAGIRGIVGDSLVVEEFLKYVLAFATIMEGGPVVLGSDSRVSRHMMRHLAFAGLESAGCTIYDIGLAPTPTVGMMITRLGARGGIAVTASHNPAEWNAYKFFDRHGSFLNADQNKTLLEIAENSAFRREEFNALGHVQPVDDAIVFHVEKVTTNIDTSAVAAKGYRAVVDCVNGVGGLIMKPLLERMGVAAEFLHVDVDSPFPRNPEPLPENLSELGARVRATGADIGFALDPDADRLAIVDETGRPIGEERTMVLAAMAALEKKRGPLVANLSTTRALDDVAAKFEVPLYRTAIGEANVVARIREAEALIGGEGNGGVIYPAVHTGRDAATGVALVLSAMAAKGMRLSELNAQAPDYAMVKTKFPLGKVKFADAAKRVQKALSDATTINLEDGVKASFPHSWVHVRPSGTEPVVRIFAEAATETEARALVERVNSAI